MEYDEYMEKFFNKDGQELQDYDYDKWHNPGLTDEQIATLKDLQEQQSDQATADFYEKYGLEPPE